MVIFFVQEGMLYLPSKETSWGRVFLVPVLQLWWIQYMWELISTNNGNAYSLFVVTTCFLPWENGECQSIFGPLLCGYEGSTSVWPEKKAYVKVTGLWTFLVFDCHIRVLAWNENKGCFFCSFFWIWPEYLKTIAEARFFLALTTLDLRIPQQEFGTCNLYFQQSCCLLDPNNT